MSTVSAYAASDSTGHLSKTTITRRQPGPHDVAFDIKFAGICHSDIHTVKAEWGVPNYPVVPGHEIPGVVTAVGDDDLWLHRQGRHPDPGRLQPGDRRQRKLRRKNPRLHTAGRRRTATVRGH